MSSSVKVIKVIASITCIRSFPSFILFQWISLLLARAHIKKTYVFYNSKIMDTFDRWKISYSHRFNNLPKIRKISNFNEIFSNYSLMNGVYIESFCFIVFLKSFIQNLFINLYLIRTGVFSMFLIFIKRNKWTSYIFFFFLNNLDWEYIKNMTWNLKDIIRENSKIVFLWWVGHP